MEIRPDDVLAAIELAPFDDEAARALMAGSRRHDHPEPPAYRDSGVLVLLYPGAAGLTLLLTRRADDVEHHRGQISLPGGARENDEPLLATALREAEEEVGIRTDGIRILGRLGPFPIPVSRFLVHPFVGFLPERPEFRPDPREVARIIEAPLALLLAKESRGEEEWVIHGRTERVPFFRLPGVGHPPLWGATAMILSGLVERLRHSM